MAKSKRCAWVTEGDEAMLLYHDREWGVPVRNDRTHFEFLTLEGAQAGLSWRAILMRRSGYRRAFHRFDPKRVAQMTSRDVKRLLEDEGIIRHRGKIESTIQNAKCFLRIQQEFGSFDRFVWEFVGGRPKINRWRSQREVPATSEESLALSRELRRRGFRFVGPTIMYAYMQAVGLVNDHLVHCPCFKTGKKR